MDNLLSEPHPHLRRLIQTLWIALLVLAATCAQNAYHHRWTSVLLLLGTGVLIGTAILLARAGHAEAATSLTFGCLAFMATSFLWIGQGPRDPAVVVFPAILVFAAILGNRKLFLALLGFLLTAVAVVVLGNVQGWHVTPSRPIGWGLLVDLFGILLGTGFVVWILASDLRRALAGLRAEHNRAVQSQTQVDFLAQHDALTGLPNRAMGRDRLEQAMALAQRGQGCTALIHLDLDDFKAINDSFGPEGGDELLQKVGLRLGGILRSADTVARQGGDEFLLVLQGIQGGDEAAAVAGKILEEMAAPIRMGGLDVTLTVSMGLALYPADGEDCDGLMRKASCAVDEAKAAGGNTFRFFMAGMNESAQAYLHLLADLRRGLAERAFVLHYQPQYDLLSGAIIGAEALIRWQHPLRGLVAPGVFIPVAERSGLIGEIGAWALREACRQAQAWREQGLDLIMAVNLSPAQFRRNDLEISLVRALEESRLPSSALELELTESMLILDAEAVSQRLRSLREMGLSFAIDDFGTGYSNLGYLKKFEVERLKIDQSFVRHLGDSPQDEAIVVAIIQMAHALNLGVVAEGIETEAALRRLRELGCDMGQGFLWAKALPAPEFEAFFLAAQA